MRVYEAILRTPPFAGVREGITANGDPEVDAIAACVAALEPLTIEAKRRALAYLCDRMLAIAYEAPGE